MVNVAEQDVEAETRRLGGGCSTSWSRRPARSRQSSCRRGSPAKAVASSCSASPGSGTRAQASRRPHRPARPLDLRERRLHDGGMGADGGVAPRTTRRPRPDRHAPLPARAIRGRVRADGRPPGRRRQDRPRARGLMRLARLTTAVVEANYDWTIVRAESDEGLVGWGEAFCAPGLPETIRELAPLIEGRDARHVEPLVRGSTSRPRTSRAEERSTTRSRVSRRRSGTRCTLARGSALAALRRLLPRPRADLRRLPRRRGVDELQRDARLAPTCPGWEPTADRDGRPEEHWAPAEAATCTRPRRTRRASSMADRGFTALKFDLDLPLLANEDLYARTISARAARASGRDRHGRRRGRPGRADVAFDLHWRYAPADALRLARALEGCPCSGSRTRRRLRTSSRSHASRSARRRRSARARTSTGSTASPRS